jgi:cell cycle protein kinase DBF2
MAEPFIDIFKLSHTDFPNRHRKPTVDEDGKPSSPRKPLSNVDESFGTIF